MVRLTSSMELPGLGLDYDLVVGTSEKHHVVYHWGQLSGLTRISVDGVEVLKKHRMFDFFRTKWRCEVSIGKIEVHRFAVEQRILWFWGGFTVYAFQFFVDDEPVWTY